MKSVLSSILAALAAIVLLSPTAADARPLDEIIKSGFMRVGVHPNGPPRSSYNAKGELEGYDVDIADEICEILGVKCEYVPTETPQRIPNLIADRTDIQLGALTRKPSRMAVIDYSVPLHTESMATLTTKEYAEKNNIKSHMDLGKAGARVVDCRGCNPGLWAEANIPGIKMLWVDASVDAVRAVAQGRADAIIENLDFYMVFTEKYPDVNWHVLPAIIKTAYCGIGVAKGNDTVRHWLNSALFQLQEENHHEEAWKKWFGSYQVAPVVPQPYW